MKHNLGARIKHYRKLRRLSQPELAHALKVDKQTVWRWEKGRSWPEYDKLEAICKAVGVTMDDLFENLVQSRRPTEPSAEQLVSALSEAFLDDSFRARFVTVLRARALADPSKKQ